MTEKNINSTEYILYAIEYVENELFINIDALEVKP